MNDTLNKISASIFAFREDAKMAAGNKAAAARSRKESLKLEKLLKEWRKVSLNK